METNKSPPQTPIIHNYLSKLFFRPQERQFETPTLSSQYLHHSATIPPNKRHRHDHPQSTKSGGPTKEKARMTLICRSEPQGVKPTAKQQKTWKEPICQQQKYRIPL
ncbi:hypothetical protein CDAR_42381 [Caerostris darwini]|uniref:Uncharacterized protein n=1 Tax=Caerostris darwini TaxID=1538125 RepID=A0AAV4RK20_9ARAC|nr:hypothetical protein CDAR_42381 [Caerostris darwini]